MISLHHFVNFWENNNNWIEPQSFDTLFKVLLAVYLVITFVPDFVKYLSVSNLVRIAKIQKFTYEMLEELILKFEEEVEGKKNLYLTAYSSFLNGMDLTFVQIEEKLFRVWKKYVLAHLTVILVSIAYLFFSANHNHDLLIHRQMLSIIIIVLLMPFFFSFYSAFQAIRPNILVAKNYLKRIKEVSNAYQHGKINAVLQLMSKYAEEDLRS